MQLPEDLKAAAQKLEILAVQYGYDLLTSLSIEVQGVCSGDININVEDPELTAEVIFAVAKAEPELMDMISRIADLVLASRQTAFLN